jgi:hypothetical protein
MEYELYSNNNAYFPLFISSLVKEYKYLTRVERKRVPLESTFQGV